jgi:hypothetical protein
MDSAMVLLLLVLGGVMVYMVFAPTSLIGPWLDKYCKDEKRSWSGEDITPDYNTNQDIHDAISQEKVPFTPALDIPFNDPEVPNRPSKKKPKKKRVYKKRSKKK